MNGRVLVVDDSSLARRTNRLTLERAGFTVLEAEDGMAALERYALERPDLVILDLVMRGLHGLDVLVKLREFDPNARVIVVSADIQTPSRDSCYAAGAAAFVTKPAEPGELLEAVNAALEPRR